MHTAIKIVIGIAGAATAAYLLKLDNTAQHLNARLMVMAHSLKWNGLTLKVQALLNNPTSLPLQIQYPYIEVFYEGKQIGTSIIENKQETIEADSTKTLNFMIEIPLIGLVGVLFNFFKSVMSKSPIKVKAKIISSLYTKVGRVPFIKEVEQTLDLKNI
jgi:hypothetical protein